MRKSKYKPDDIARFYNRLELYRLALAKGTSHDIILTSLAVYSMRGVIPPRLRSLINWTFKETKREIPLKP